MRVEGEEISAVVRDMDEFSDKCIGSRRATTEEALALIIHQYARRVEEAAKRAEAVFAHELERHKCAAGNIAALRGQIMNCISRLKSIAMQNREWQMCANNDIMECEAALSAPSRNFDRFLSADDAIDGLVRSGMRFLSANAREAIYWLFAKADFGGARPDPTKCGDYFTRQGADK